MAFVQLITHYITSGIPDGVHTTGRYIHVLADGATLKTEIWTTSDNSGTLISTPSGGPVLGSEIIVSSSSFNDYRYCDSTDQVYYTQKNEWPYLDYNLATDHPSCAIITCDLEITGFTVTNETAVGVGNGQIALTYSGSNGVAKYSLDPDFVYASGQDSPLTGLSTGNYVIYAKDPAGCIDAVNVFVGIDYVYGVRWRSEYDCIFPSGYSSRIDIEERDYEGAIIETCSGENPFELTQEEREDLSLTNSHAVIQLAVEWGENNKFIDIRRGYDRQFLLKKYKDTGSGFVLEWVGYITPEFYKENYLDEPYYVEFKAIDGLIDMANKDFVALSGEEYFGDMSVMEMVNECLKKLPYQINLRSCVNIFETRMNTAASDDPLPQTYMKSQNFRGMKCGEVITTLIKPFNRSELFQSLGYWWIRTKEQSIDSTLLYREFADGVYISNSSIASRKDAAFPLATNRFIWKDKSQVLSFTRNYGSFKVTHELDKDNNMIDSGGFEEEDIDTSTEFFRDWQVYPAQTLVTSGLEYVDNSGSKGAFFFQWNASGSNQTDNILSFTPLPISFLGNVFEDKQTSFKLNFETYVSPAWPIDWVRLGWKFRFVDTDTGDFWDWHAPPSLLAVPPSTNVARINEIYLSNFNSWQKHEFYGFRAPGDINAINFTVQVLFYFHDHKGRDYPGFAALRAEPTLGIFEEGKRFYVEAEGRTIAYEFQRNTDAEVEPDIIRPNDYHAVAWPGVSLNPYQWVKLKEYNIDGAVPIVDRIMIDNVKVSLFTLSPNLQVPGFKLIDPPETVIYEQEVSAQNEAVFEDSVKAGDAPDIVGSNYIYNGFFKLSDGTQTVRWGRSSVLTSGTGELLSNTDFANSADWDQEGTGADWAVGSGAAQVEIATGNSKILGQTFDYGLAGDYVFELQRISTNFAIGTDSANFGITFYDDTDTLIGSASVVEFISGNNNVILTHPFTTLVPVRRVEIILVWNSGADMNISVEYATLEGPKAAPEQRYLLDIYLGHLIAQGARSLRVLNGSGIADIQLGYIHSLEDQIDLVKYRFKRFVFQDKQGFYEVEIEETLTGADGESPPLPNDILLAEDGVTPVTTETGDWIYV